ncbi:sensor domain-containing diguanylate cyclase [Amphritea opalescens]|nr:diguanylate cyclase [Amphritea opalescens]
MKTIMSEQRGFTASSADAEYLLTHPVPSRSVIPLILSLFGVSLVSIIGLVMLTLVSMEGLTEDNFKQRVKTAFNIEMIRQQGILQEYSYWDEAHQKLIVEPDEDWAKDNLGAYLQETYGIDLVWAFTSDMQPVMTLTDGEQVMISASELQLSDLQTLVQAAVDSDMPHIVSGYREFFGTPYLVSIGMFLDEDEMQKRSDGTFLLFAYRLDDHKIQRVRDEYLLPGLRFSTVNNGEQSDSAKVSLYNSQGVSLANLNWDTVSPSDKYFVRLLLPVVLIFIVMALLTWRLLVGEYANRQLYSSHLIDMATKDFLTNISNRREFYLRANHEISRSHREQTSLALLMMDLDHFKKINDSLGHSAGDDVLAEFARLVQENIREFDIFGRVGGEEFAVLLVAADLAKAEEIGERIRRVIGEYAFPSLSGSPLQCTVSVGVAVWDGEEALDRLMVRSDEALYTAKDNGRNRVSVA